MEPPTLHSPKSRLAWSGNPTKRKGVTEPWIKLCKPKPKGGMGMRRLEDTNNSFLMNMAWDIFKNKGTWGTFMNKKHRNKNGEWKVNSTSTVWNGIKLAMEEIESKQERIIGDHWIRHAPINECIAPNNPIWKKNSKPSLVIAFRTAIGTGHHSSLR